MDSTPLAGITVFRTCCVVTAAGEWSRFPSPGGDYGLSDSSLASGRIPLITGFRPLAGITVFRTRAVVTGSTRSPTSFRPLAGITVFRTLVHWRSGRVAHRVSVPWRGLRSFGPNADPMSTSVPEKVSVPWRGLRSFGPGLARKGTRRIPSFPSPGGDYGLSDKSAKETRTFEFVGFRPLAGITVFRT